MSFLGFGKKPNYKPAINAINSVELPDIEAMKIRLEQLVQQGILSPEDAQAYLIENNAYNDIALDPATRGAQMDALTGLQDVAQNGGMNLADQAGLQKIMDEQANYGRGQREAIMTDARRRGVGGSGMETVAQLMAEQEGANRAGRQGLDIAAQAQQRALEAMIQGGNLGGQIRGQDYAQEANKAQAQNAINQFNSSNQQQISMANVQARNQAAAQNLAQKQQIANSNTQNENANRERNANLLQQNFGNKMQKANAVAGVYGQKAQGDQAANAADAQFFGSLLGAAGKAYAGGGMYAGGKVECMNEGGEVPEQERTFIDVLRELMMSKDAAVTRPRSQFDEAMGMIDGQVPPPPQPQQPINMQDGGQVPGQEVVPGDSPVNDTVPAMLSAGEYVVPKSQVPAFEDVLQGLPRSQNKPSSESVKLVLQALSEMEQ